MFKSIKKPNKNCKSINILCQIDVLLLQRDVFENLKLSQAL